MARILQKSIFVWSEIEESDDLSRFNLILNTIPDEPLVEMLEKERGSTGVNKYPIRAVWNSLIAGILFEHSSIESLRRELMRNPSLREHCGFNPLLGTAAVPSAGSYSRFIKKLITHQDELNEIFQALLRKCYHTLEGFGETLAIDGKSLPSFGRRSDNVNGDLRGEHDGDWGKHVYHTTGKDGKIYEKIKKWFGFKLHLIVDSRYELPVEFTVVNASANEMPVAHNLLDRMGKNTPDRLKKCETFLGDRGYDDGKLLVKLWDDYGIKPVIDIRNCWQDGDKTRMLKKYPDLVYDYKGEVFCYCQKTATRRAMALNGFEKDRNCLKYQCPVVRYGIECKSRSCCSIPEQVRISLSEDRRIFTPIARSSYRWKRMYNGRSAIERVNSRIDRMFGFENHTIRGIGKMQFRVTFAFILMLAFAVGKVEQDKPLEIRKFLRSA